MSAIGSSLNPVVVRAFAMADAGTPKMEIIAELGIGRSTLYRWLNDESLAETARRHLESERFSERQSARNRAAEMLANGDRICDIAKAVGVDRRTVWRWCRDPEYVAEVEAARKAVSEHVGLRLTLAAEGAVDVLTSLMTDPETPPREKRMAAEAILERALPRASTIVEAHASANTTTIVSDGLDLPTPPTPDELEPEEIHAIARILLTAEERNKSTS